MKILSIDTCAEQFSLALSIDNNPVYYNKINKKNSHAENISSEVNLALKKGNISYHNLDYIVATKGPGSFTGVRAGLALINSAVMLTKVKPVTFSRFSLYKYYAMKQAKNIDKICVILRAYGNEFYVQTFDIEKDNKSTHKIMTKQQIFDYLNSPCNKNTVCCGDSLEDRELMDMIFSLKLMFLPRIACAKILVKLGISNILSDKIDTNLTPIYIKPPSTN